MKIKEIKIINQDESTEVADIGANAQNIDYNDTTVKAELDKLNSDNNTNKNSILQLRSSVSGLASGSPKGYYTTEANLISANPATGVYIITSTGHIHSWTKNDSSSIDLGVYQAAENSDDLEINTTLRKNMTNNIHQFGLLPATWKWGNLNNKGEEVKNDNHDRLLSSLMKFPFPIKISLLNTDDIYEFKIMYYSRVPSSTFNNNRNFRDFSTTNGYVFKNTPFRIVIKKVGNLEVDPNKDWKELIYQKIAPLDYPNSSMNVFKDCSIIGGKNIDNAFYAECPADLAPYGRAWIANNFIWNYPITITNINNGEYGISIQKYRISDDSWVAGDATLWEGSQVPYTFTPDPTCYYQIQFRKVDDSNLFIAGIEYTDAKLEDLFTATINSYNILNEKVAEASNTLTEYVDKSLREYGEPLSLTIPTFTYPQEFYFSSKKRRYITEKLIGDTYESLQAFITDKENNYLYKFDGTSIVKKFNLSTGELLTTITKPGQTGHDNGGVFFNNTFYLPYTETSHKKGISMWNLTDNNISIVDLDIQNNTSLTETERIVASCCKNWRDDNLLIATYDINPNNNLARYDGAKMVIYSYNLSDNTLSPILTDEKDFVFIQGMTCVNDLLYIATNIYSSDMVSTGDYRGIEIKVYDLLSGKHVDSLYCKGNFESEGLDYFMDNGQVKLIIGLGKYSKFMRCLKISI